MTILFFARLFWPHGGGVETHVLEVGKRLIGKGYKVVVVTELLAKTKEKENIGGIEIFRIPVGKDNWFKKFRIWKWFWQNRKLIQQADIAHAHDVFFWYLPFRFLYLNKPIYTTFHGYETKFPPAKKAIFVRRLSEKLSWGNICVGDYIKKWYKTKPNYITYGGVNVHLGGVMVSQAQQPATIRGEDQKLNILFIGRLEEDIGISLYLQAIRKMKKTRNVDVIFLGDGSFRHEAEKLGRVTTFQEKFVVQADVVFASSYLSMLSAMAAKKPVVAVYTNSLKKDYLTMTPFAKFITIVDSLDKIVDTVKNLEKTNQMVDQAYDWVKGQTWEKIVNLYIKLWKMN
ncbi:MAG: glycosyltransferase family 4 protein [Candidatus Levyibacteriota bacterium]|nr:MAG: glycosyltransferase family 4 protein [Candidatus Levybacteria bacterium]